MKDTWSVLRTRVMSDVLLLRGAGWFSGLFSLVYFAMAARGLAQSGATRGEIYLGLVMAGFGSVMLLMLGMLTHHYAIWSKKVSVRERTWEFVSYALCMGVLVGGILPLPGLDLSRVQVLFGALVVGGLSLSILVLGMFSSVLRALKN